MEKQNKTNSCKMDAVTALKQSRRLEQSEAAHKLVVEALLKSEEKYRELVENANSIIIKMDRNGKITFFNDYAQKLFGYHPDEILGKDV